jgi:hypothetical protein
MLCPYSSDELKELRRILDDIISEARRRPELIHVDDIIEKVFELADHGERDPGKLRDAVLKNAA